MPVLAQAKTSLNTLAPVAAAEQREAAFGGEAVVKSADAIFQVNRVRRVCDGFAAERSLALLGSCYKKLSGV
ncbi:hypothetical protein HKK52_05720 [Pseudomonas sp. ADAK2]|uniref:hypothetical protein n=1 Tax=Pseudomonas TaxID=286 RepID=UPI001463E585|nr:MULTISPECIES: hypothetical protein [unclassified Pseudomonas]QJI40439.1 hypothetical protein HKK53_05715 [Pseudomonas sp. ADAK7]QJI46744.1 hypothetical protein HKK52_05720 [Pseudomonas sp. ADAK2]